MKRMYNFQYACACFLIFNFIQFGYGQSDEKVFLFQGNNYSYNPILTDSFDDNVNNWMLFGNPDRGDEYVSISNGEYQLDALSYYISEGESTIVGEVPIEQNLAESPGFQISFKFKVTHTAPDIKSFFRLQWNDLDEPESFYAFDVMFDETGLYFIDVNNPVSREKEDGQNDWGFYNTSFNEWQTIRLRKMYGKYTVHVNDILEETIFTSNNNAVLNQISFSSNLSISIDNLWIEKIVLIEETPVIPTPIEEVEDILTVQELRTPESQIVYNEPSAPLKTTKQNSGTFHALIIGNNDYQDPNLPSLDQPIKDAITLYDVLLSDYTFEKENIIFLKNATRKDVIRQLDKLSDELTDQDNLLIFYAGHGYWDENKGQGYWMPIDAESDLTADWLRNSTIQGYIESIDCRHTLLIADACFGGGIFKTRGATFDDASKSVNNLYKYKSRKAMTSGMLNEVPDKSVFMESLVMKLNDNENKYLPSMELFMQFRENVMNNSFNAPQYGTIHNTGDQGGDFIFIRKIE